MTPPAETSAAAQAKLRVMTAADLAEVARIESLSSPAPWSEDLFRGCLRPDYLCRVLEQGERVVAFAVANHAAGEGHLLNIAVHPSHRTLGLGRRLLDAMTRLLRRRFVGMVYLEVRRFNEQAIALYRRFGFDVIGMRADYYARRDGREDALTMRCVLAAEDADANGIERPG